MEWVAGVVYRIQSAEQAADLHVNCSRNCHNYHKSTQIDARRIANADKKAGACFPPIVPAEGAVRH